SSHVAGGSTASLGAKIAAVVRAQEQEATASGSDPNHSRSLSVHAALALPHHQYRRSTMRMSQLSTEVKDAVRAEALENLAALQAQHAEQPQGESEPQIDSVPDAVSEAAPSSPVPAQPAPPLDLKQLLPVPRLAPQVEYMKPKMQAFVNHPLHKF